MKTKQYEYLSVCYHCENDKLQLIYICGEKHLYCVPTEKLYGENKSEVIGCGQVFHKVH